jgi:hypothetical protein
MALTRNYDNILNVIARYKSLLDVLIIFLFPLIGTYNKYSLNRSLQKKINDENDSKGNINVDMKLDDTDKKEIVF